MSAREEFLVVEVLAGDGPITKVSDGTKTGGRYTFPIVYRLEDGRLIPATDSRRRLRDAKAEVATLPHTPRGYVLRVSLDEEGELYMTSRSFDTLDFLQALEKVGQKT